jgi:hypothetical protein
MAGTRQMAQKMPEKTPDETLDDLGKVWYDVGSYPPFARACPAPAGHALL